MVPWVHLRKSKELNRKDSANTVLGSNGLIQCPCSWPQLCADWLCKTLAKALHLLGPFKSVGLDWSPLALTVHDFVQFSFMEYGL